MKRNGMVKLRTTTLPKPLCRDMSVKIPATRHKTSNNRTSNGDEAIKATGDKTIREQLIRQACLSIIDLFKRGFQEGSRYAFGPLKKLLLELFKDRYHYICMSLS
jgi:hypothetical protein